MMEQNNYPIRVAQVMGKMNNGGVEAVVMNYYRHIDRTKIQFDFIVDTDSKCPQRKEIELLGGKVYFVPPYSRILKYDKALKKIFIENKYKIVHSHITTLNVFPLRVAKRCNIPIRISHAHSTAGKGEFVRNCIKYLLRPFSKMYANYYFACGEYAGKWLYGKKTFNRGDVFVLNNAIDVDKFKFNEIYRNEIRNKYNIKQSTFVIGHIGRFVSQKNHKFLINVFKKYHEKNVDSKLMLIGEGPLENDIKNQVESLGLSDSVLFVGVVNDGYKYYNAFDCFMLPSTYEGLPVVGVEAQCNGLPCIFSDRMTKEVLLNRNSELKKLTLAEWSDLSLKTKERTIVDENKMEKFDINCVSCFLSQKYLMLVNKKWI